MRYKGMTDVRRLKLLSEAAGSYIRKALHRGVRAGIQSWIGGNGPKISECGLAWRNGSVRLSRSACPGGLMGLGPFERRAQASTHGRDTFLDD
jgi:hypothetical protein